VASGGNPTSSSHSCSAHSVLAHRLARLGSWLLGRCKGLGWLFDGARGLDAFLCPCRLACCACLRGAPLRAQLRLAWPLAKQNLLTLLISIRMRSLLYFLSLKMVAGLIQSGSIVWSSPNSYIVESLTNFGTATASCIQISLQVPGSGAPALLPTQTSGGYYVSVSVNTVAQLTSNSMTPSWTSASIYPNQPAYPLSGSMLLSPLSSNGYQMWGAGSSSYCQIGLSNSVGWCNASSTTLPTTIGLGVSTASPSAYVLTMIYWKSSTGYPQNTSEPLQAYLSVQNCPSPSPPSPPPPSSPVASSSCNTAACSGCTSCTAAQTCANTYYCSASQYVTNFVCSTYNGVGTWSASCASSPTPSPTTSSATLVKSAAGIIVATAAAMLI
jgi:hypothetical protein